MMMPLISSHAAKALSSDVPFAASKVVSDRKLAASYLKLGISLLALEAGGLEGGGMIVCSPVKEWKKSPHDPRGSMSIRGLEV